MIVGDAALVRRLESFQARVGAANAFARAGGEVLDVAGGKAVFFTPDSPITQAIGVGIGEPVTVADVDRVEDFFRSRGAACSIHITPWSDAVLLAELSSRRYQVFEFENAFVQRIDAIASNPADPAIEVHLIERDEASTWARVCAAGFATEGVDEEMLREIGEAFTAAEGGRCYLASIDGIACGAAASVSVRDLGVVGLFGAATLPEFRGRGVQNALVARRLAEASGEGCELAFVSTLPGSASHRNVLRRGFELVYTKVSMKRVFEV
jgi:GNAT superfamily N-acetyltransferase